MIKTCTTYDEQKLFHKPTREQLIRTEQNRQKAREIRKIRLKEREKQIDEIDEKRQLARKRKRDLSEQRRPKSFLETLLQEILEHVVSFLNYEDRFLLLKLNNHLKTKLKRIVPNLEIRNFYRG